MVPAEKPYGSLLHHRAGTNQDLSVSFVLFGFIRSEESCRVLCERMSLHLSLHQRKQTHSRCCKP